MEIETNDRPVDVVSVTALESIERASIDMQIATAKKYPMHAPRMLSRVKEDMMTLATLDEETAEACFYTLPRSGKVIQGPSVRLAEIALNCYGNIRVGARILNVNSGMENPHVVVQSVCHDLENNTLITIEKRRRITKKKNKLNIDEDDIQLAVNACTSIAYRDATFKIVPMAIIKPVWQAAKRLAVGDVKSLSVKRATVIDKLKKMGATEDRILAVVECRKIEDIGVEELGQLIGLGTALKDGETTLEDAFPPIIEEKEKQSGVQGLRERLQKKNAETKEEDKPETKEEVKPETKEEVTEEKNKVTEDNKKDDSEKNKKKKKTSKKTESTKKETPEEIKAKVDTVTKPDSVKEAEKTAEEKFGNEYKYTCLNCGERFNTPSVDSKGNEKCPDCLKTDIIKN